MLRHTLTCQNRAAYMHVFSAEQCEQVIDALRPSDHDRMRHGEHGGEERMGA